MLTWPDTGKCDVKKGPELAQVGFDPAVKFLLTNVVLKEAGKVILPCHSSPYIYFHVKMMSHYARVNFFLTHTV